MCIYIHICVCICVCIYIYIYTCLPTYLPTYLPACLPAYLPTCLPTYLPTYLHTYIHTYITCICVYNTYAYIYIYIITALLGEYAQRPVLVRASYFDAPLRTIFPKPRFPKPQYTQISIRCFEGKQLFVTAAPSGSVLYAALLCRGAL